MTCLMIIAQTKNTNLASSNSSINIKRIAAQYKPIIWKGRNYGNLLHGYLLYENTIVATLKQPVRGVSRKQLILSCKNIKTDNLQLENS